ncbi:MAG: phage antirepressor KilAC domain-containing protein [Oscillospiraceae bacterium]|nr:phage antirepressor KilAC domain-containing protein [Oscillospiraceae bacterium]
MNELKIFENPEFGKVRTMEINGEPYFVGKDVSEILGYSDTNKAIAMHVDDEDKLNDKTASSLGQRGGWLINESGLYSLILSSKLLKAKEFKRWVTSEVLPSIRKHGVYAVDELIANPDIAIAAFQALKNEREKNRQLNDTVAVQLQQIAELQPKASYYDVVLNCKDLLSITEIAKDYGKSAKWLNNYLHDHKIQFKQGGIWLLYSNHAEKGYTSTKTQTFNGNDGRTHTKVHTYWTQKGRLFIYDLLKSKGIVPLIER